MIYLYRLYIDEVGNHDIKYSLKENERFLTLFGVWASVEQIQNIIVPEMSKIKSEYFHSDPDSPIVFHRKEISKYSGPFKVLFNDKQLRDNFGNRMLQAYRDWEYTAVAVTIDKKEHISRYHTWYYEPYHYCFEVLLERYVLFLHYRGFRGDVMSESRNKLLDKKLKNTYSTMYQKGTKNIRVDIMKKVLTSCELKLKKKSANVAGLQLSDLLAHSAHYDLLEKYRLVKTHNSEYGREIAKILYESKYNRDRHSGRIEGFGKKLLP